MNILVKGAGVAGLTVAYELRARGAEVTILDPFGGENSAASWYAGGMLAPWCERESAEQAVIDLGINAANWWESVIPGSVSSQGNAGGGHTAGCKRTGALWRADVGLCAHW